MSNPYVKKAVLGTRDYHETMRGIVRTIVNDSLHAQMTLHDDRWEVVDAIEIKHFPSDNLSFLERYTIQTDMCYRCVLHVRQWQRSIFYHPKYILVAGMARDNARCSVCEKTLRP